MASKDQSEGLAALGKKDKTPGLAGEPEMSSVILELAKPLYDHDSLDVEDVQGTIGLTIFAWNKAMLPADVHDIFERAFIDAVVPADGDARSIGRFIQITELVEQRRKTLFPDLRRYISEVDIQVCDKEPVLNIVSIPVPDEDGPPADQ